MCMNLCDCGCERSALEQQQVGDKCKGCTKCGASNPASECRERKRERSAALEQQVGEMGAQLRQLAALRHELTVLAAANE